MEYNRISKAHMVFQSLRDDILGGVLGPNERLVERELVERFRVSKTPVREALNMLRSEGLATGDYYRGMKVVQLSIRALKELYDVREVLEGLAARCAAAEPTKELVDSLAANIEAQEACVHGQTDQWWDLNATFHGLILEHCGNASLAAVLGRLYSQHRVMWSATLNPLWNQPRVRNEYVLQEHKCVLMAIKNTDALESEVEARRHVRNAFRRLKEPETWETRV